MNGPATAVALVTGASSGIGQATAARLARAGFRVFGTSRRGMVTVPGVEALALDVTEDASAAACVAAVADRAGRIDLLVNNAGFALVGALEESSVTQAKAIFECNVFGVMRMTRAALPIMRAQRGGRIVHVSSIVGFVVPPFSGLYAATKHAVEAYSEALDHEVRTFGIRSILVEPGFMATRIGEHMPRPDEPLPAYDAGRRAVGGVFAEALAKAPSPEAVAEAILGAARARRPRLRVTVGREAGTLAALRRLAPAALFDRSVRRQFRLEPA